MGKHEHNRVASAYSKRTKPLPDPFKVFTHGRRFMLADEQVRRKAADGTSDLGEFVWLALPSIVLSAFACEIFIKTLLILEGKSPPESHNLYTLYKRLDNKTKDRLDLVWRVHLVDFTAHLDEIEKLKGRKLTRDLRGALKECGDAFVDTRYYYEEPSGSMYYLTVLPRILHGYILERQPEWNSIRGALRADLDLHP